MTERNRSQERHSRCSPTVLEMVRYTAESLAAANEKRAVDRAVTDHGDLTVKIRNRWAENFPDENALPPTARVSAEARDENV